ncbi:MAG: helix-turn-helix domain-containing protein [Candidatus Bathyarchaeia archaeon]
MSIEDALNMLQIYGLTKTQAQIFIHLIRAGASSIGALAKALKTNRMNIYRNLKKMQNMGLINIIPGRPLKFSAIPANMALNMLLSAAKDKILEMESKYSQILDVLSKLSNQQDYAIETKFRVHSGRRKVYNVMMQMLEDSEREICLLTTPNDLICLSFHGFDNVLKKISEKNVKVKILTNVTDEKIALMLRDYMKYAVIKHSDIQMRTRFLIIDDKIAFTSLTVDESINLESESDSGFWTDSPHYISSIKIFFDMVWRSAQDISIALQYLKTGKKLEKTIVFSDLEEYYSYLTGIINRAEGEALICIKQLKKPYVTGDFTQTLKEANLRGAKIKILTYLDEESAGLGKIFDAAEVRHADIGHINMNFIVTDTGESLLFFPPSSAGGNIVQVQGLWSNFIGFTCILNEVFMELWARSISPTTRLTEIRFRKIIKEIPKKLSSIAEEKGLLLEMPAIIRGASGLNQKFDLALRVRDSIVKEIIVGDFLPEEGNIKTALISLYVKAMDIKAHQKLFIIPKVELLSSDEMELASAYNIALVDGLEADEVSRKIMEKIKSIHNL